MKTMFSRAATRLRDIVSGRRRLKEYGYPEAHRHSHNRDANLAHHYRPTSQLPINGPGGM
ncbi:hypothetical protein [Streptomyces sp. NPDC005209]|uniref:hypothetical protein n=1 Tax=Streptomyces sp. NPDC005209 TaxID=3156715 RepID=UPI0033A8BE98